MTADLIGLHTDPDAAHRRRAAYEKVSHLGPVTDADRSLAAQYLAYKAIYGLELSGDDRLILATRIAAEHVADRALDLFRALVWELGRGFGPLVAQALDDLIYGVRS